MVLHAQTSSGMDAEYVSPSNREVSPVPARTGRDLSSNGASRLGRHLAFRSDLSLDTGYDPAGGSAWAECSGLAARAITLEEL